MIDPNVNTVLTSQSLRQERSDSIYLKHIDLLNGFFEQNSVETLEERKRTIQGIGFRQDTNLHNL